MGSTLGVKYDLILALRGQIFECLLETFYRYALEYLQSARSGKKRKADFFFFFCLLKILAITHLFERLWSVGTRFRHRRQSYSRS